MKINENILKKYIEIPEKIEEITNNHIIEVESFGPLSDITHLVIGKVLTCEKHPDSDHLSLTTVDLGDEIKQIVCGAPNVAANQTVIVAKVGAVLPGNFVIKEAKIRGVESSGMICSLTELGIDEKYLTKEENTGIHVIKEPLKPGSSALAYLGLEGFNLELGLTPNRSDLLSHVGFAYDLGAMTNQKVTLPKIKIKEENTENPLKITSEAKDCFEYNARYFDDIEVKESPLWLKNTLLAADIRPINNVVDISNYVLIEYGTPLHMFDAKKVETNHIHVRYAKENETVITLDEEKRTLENTDLVITNNKEVIAIAGVMGLLNTSITNETKEVILEAAYFNPQTIAKTSKRLNLKSDSSLRFERGIDQSLVIEGLNRASELLIELANAKVRKGVLIHKENQHKTETISFELHEINQKSGLSLTAKEVKNYLERLRYQVEQNKESFKVFAPENRYDIFELADIVEEIIRVHGFDSIPVTKLSIAGQGKLSSRQRKVRNLRHLLADLGLNEIITYSLISEEELNLFKNDQNPITLMMPLSANRNILRQSLLVGLIETISYNQTRQNENNAFFEIGKTYTKETENLTLSIGLSGKYINASWIKKDVASDFFLLKGLLEKVTNQLGIQLDYVKTEEHSQLHPGIQANLIYQNQIVGVIGQTHPNLERKYDINKSYVLELNLEEILKNKQEHTYQLFSKYPSITRDIAFIVDKTYPVSDIIALIKQTTRKYLTNYEMFDLYQGTHVQEGKHSLAFSLTFNDPQKTLEKEDVDKIMKSVRNRLEFTFKAEIRD